VKKPHEKEQSRFREPARNSLGSRALATICLLTTMVATRTAASEEYSLEQKLEPVGVATAKSAKIKFTLVNRGTDFVRILTWNTPLSGEIASRMFAVTCKSDNQEHAIPFEGLLRSASAGPGPAAGKVSGDETLKSAVWIDPGEERSGIVDLVAVYKLPPSSECTVAFRGLITVVRELQGATDQPKLDFTHAAGNPLVLKMRG
jgi:hypothetical protein